MGWFDEQIKQRKLNDQEVFEESLFEMAAAVLGSRAGSEASDERIITKNAIEDILKFYHLKPTEIPETITNPAAQLDYSLRPHGLMHRVVKLSSDWYMDAYGPMIGYWKEGEAPVALLPKPFGGYYYKDGASRISINKKIAGMLTEDAICFYRPLPLRKIKIPDLIVYMKKCLSTGDFVYVLVLTLLVTLVGMQMPNITRVLTGFVLSSGNSLLLAGTAGFMFCVIIVNQIITLSRRLMLNRLTIKTDLSIEAAMIMRVMNLPASFFSKYNSGELANRTSSVNQLCSLILDTVMSSALTSLMSLLYITQIFRFAPALVWPSLLILSSTLVLTIITSLVQMQISRQIMDLRAKESGVSYALISGVQKIKLAGAEKRAFSQWAKAYAKEAEVIYNPPVFITINGAIITGISLIGTISLYILAVKSGVSPSEYIAFSSAYGVVMGAFSTMAGMAESVAQIKPILDFVAPLFEAEPEMSDGKEVLTRIGGGIELNNVYFRYNDSMPYVVNGMSFKIRPGEYIAIVGKTGCGKSTLIRLLLGFEKPERGAIYYDGKDITSLDLQSLRRKIGVVTQDGSLFQGDIYSNIVISAPELTLDAAWEAAELAGMAESIRAMPMGMHTVISEGQGGISGGQKQRLMIARAVAPKPKILMFDEATSALDNLTQKRVSESLDRLRCTRIVIAHRLSTIRHCDRILVLDQGQIVEDGSYDELIAKKGMFSDLVERQRLDS